MPEYLVGICYHEPEPFDQWRRGIIEDYESTTGLWVTADSAAEAVAWGDRVGEALHRCVNGDPTANWSANYDCWLEETPAASGWVHCLDFFQTVRAGEMPLLDRMGTKAYIRWLKENPAAKGGSGEA